MPHFPQIQREPAAGSSHEMTMPKLAHAQESTEARAARLQIKTRRRRYLEMHPEYFQGSNLELAGPFHLQR